MATKKELAVQFLHDLGSASPGLVEPLTEDAVYNVNAQLLKIGPFNGKKVISEKFLPMLKSIFPSGIKMTIHNTVGDGNLVAVECSSRGDLGGGKVYANSYVFMFNFVGDKINRVTEYVDTHYAAETMKLG